MNAIEVVTTKGIESWKLSFLSARDGSPSPVSQDPDANEAFVAKFHPALWEEMTFIVKKDGLPGLVIEVEYLSKESESYFGDTDPKLLPRDEQLSQLKAKLPHLAAMHPDAIFAIAPINTHSAGRLVCWAFIPEGRATHAVTSIIGENLLRSTHELNFINIL